VATAQNTLLQSARSFVPAVVFGTDEETLQSTSISYAVCSGMRPMYSGWGCARAIANAIAAAAAMVAGCGTPACGPYWGYCCASAVAWYASALIDVGQSCS
jgi:hypothetical protein